MLGKLVKFVVGSRNDRLVKKKKHLVKKINALSEEYTKLSDAELQAKTQNFRKRLEQGEKLNHLIPEAFATVREASSRVFNMRHFDVQMIGGMILNDGKIAEMTTGEGKTLMATLAAYLNALPGKGVHVVTVNDYLAARDAEWMGRLYSFLGLTTGVIINNMDSVARRQAYAADITYGTNNEFGFDYLRDNMAFDIEQKVQRGLNFAIVDEVDSILIDEARTPLIISGPTEEGTEIYLRTNAIVPYLTRQEKEEGNGDFWVDEKSRQVHLTELGHEKLEQLMVEHGLMHEGQSLYDASNIRLMHYINASLRAHVLFRKDVEYIVTPKKEIMIVDEFTGRVMPGRRWSEGLHQAIEAKENVPIQNENQTLASITFQNYFRLYTKLSGMTGTADTEAFELNKIYGLEVVVIPTHRPLIRKDLGDLVYLTAQEKYIAIAEDIKKCVERQQPVLVGTTSIENSELLSNLLTQLKIPHEVLNAKQHEREAQIISQAGMPGAVTIATNMAGRGTDIVLGGSLDTELKLEAFKAAEAGTQLTDADKARIRTAWQARHEQVLASGGLHVIGSERHESRRIDNQLRGRSGRQGDPGSTRFYLSLEDDLMRIFASERVAKLMEKLGMGQGEAIEHPWVTRSIENAQRKVEGRNFDIRKEILAYDDVANDQRKVIYAQRDELMAAKNVSDIVVEIRKDVVNSTITRFIPPKTMSEQWQLDVLEEQLFLDFNIKIPVATTFKQNRAMGEQGIRQLIIDHLEQLHRAKEEQITTEVLQHFEKSVMLQVLDMSWKEHLAAMDYLRQGIHFRGYAQKDPKQEYKREAFQMFTGLLDHIKYEVVTILAKVQVTQEEDVLAIDEQRQAPKEMHFEHAEAPGIEIIEPTDVNVVPVSKSPEQPFIREGMKVGRNDPCPCGSGMKFKQCHGKLA